VNVNVNVDVDVNDKHIAESSLGSLA